MRSAMMKTTLREIRASFGRYMAILAIIALGVGFFAGLKVCKPFMLETADTYIDEHLLFDVRVVSTLGLTDKDVEALAAVDGIAHAEGAVYADVIFEDGRGNGSLLRAHSLTVGVNTLSLTAGRLPEAPNECAADKSSFSEDDIGTVLRVAEDNDEDQTDMLAYSEYVITGLVDSPYYLNYERGSTSVGNGSIDAFVYIPSGGFDAEAYSEVFLRFEERYTIFDEREDELFDSLEPELTETAELRGEERFEEVTAEANEEIADAERELADGWAEYYDGKAEADEELNDAYQELLDGEAELEDAEREIADAERELADGWAEYYDGVRELEDGETEIADAEKELEDGWAEYYDGVREYEDGLREYEDGKAELEDAREELRLAALKLQYAREDLDYGAEEIERQRAAAEEQFAYQETQLNSQLAAAEAQLEAIAGMGMTELEEQLQGAIARLQAGLELLDQQREQVERQLIDAENQLYSGWLQYEEGLREYEDGLREFEEGEAELNDAEQELLDGKKELDDAYQELLDGEAELNDAKQELADGRIELSDAYQELLDGEAELNDGRQELEDGRIELADGWAEYYDGKAEAEAELNDAYRELLDGEAELADAKAELAGLDKASIYVMDRSTNIGYVCFESDSSIVEAIAKLFPLFFFLVAALVCITTMNRMIGEQRTQIGVLKALGYSSGSIMGKYLVYSGSAAVIGSILGYAGGTLAFPKIIWMSYNMMYDFSPLTYFMDWPLALLSLGAALLCSAGTTLLSCRRELADAPAELIRPKSPKSGKRIFLERIGFVWKHMSFLSKVSVRNVVRYKKRLFMMIVGISGCTALIVAAFGINDSIKDVVNHQYDEISLYDAVVTFGDEPDHALFEEQCGSAVEKAAYVHQSSVDVLADDGMKNATLSVPEDPEGFSEYVDLHSGEAAVELPDEGEAVLTVGLAETLGVGIGDKVTLRDSDMNEITLTVSGVFDNYIYNYVYINEAGFESMKGAAPEYKTAYIYLREGADDAAAVLNQADDVSAVEINAETRGRISSMMASLDYIVVMVIICAAALAFIVLYNLTNINITERIRVIATIKVLGFTSLETASYVFRENMLLTAAGTLLGLPLGKLLHIFIMEQIKVDMIHFSARVTGLSLAMSVGLTVLFACVVNFTMFFKLRAVSMTESLKTIE